MQTPYIHNADSQGFCKFFVLMASVLQRKYEIRICQLTSNINMDIRTCIVQFLRLSPILQSMSYAMCSYFH